MHAAMWRARCSAPGGGTQGRNEGPSSTSSSARSAQHALQAWCSMYGRHARSSAIVRMCAYRARVRISSRALGAGRGPLQPHHQRVCRARDHEGHLCVPGLPHVMPIELKEMLISYQDYVRNKGDEEKERRTRPRAERAAAGAVVVRVRVRDGGPLARERSF